MIWAFTALQKFGTPNAHTLAGRQCNSDFSKAQGVKGFESKSFVFWLKYPVTAFVIR